MVGGGFIVELFVFVILLLRVVVIEIIFIFEFKYSFFMGGVYKIYICIVWLEKKKKVYIVIFFGYII